GVPSNSLITFGMAADGALAAVYQISNKGSQQIQMTPADSTGLWLEPQDLSLKAETGYGVAMNDDGAYVVVNEPYSNGTQFIRCDNQNACGDPETNAATGDKPVSTSLDRDGVITVVWGRGCKGEECRSSKVVAQSGH